MSCHSLFRELFKYGIPVVYASNTFFFQDILENEDLKLDNMFIASLVKDIIQVNYFIVLVI